MIKNILFDMGGVLMQFDPPAFVARLGLGPEDSQMLLREVFHSAEWVMMDRGSADEEQALSGMCARLPERLHSAARQLVYHWDEPDRAQIPGMEALAAELSGRGYGLYLLTNAAARHKSYWPHYAVSRYFGDRIMRSADWQLLKPEAAFYEKAFELFSLDRRECLFIDDSPTNAEGAIRLGLDTVVFHGDAALLRLRLREKGVTISVGTQ